jgi:hypothetical protein
VDALLLRPPRFAVAGLIFEGFAALEPCVRLGSFEKLFGEDFKAAGFVELYIGDLLVLFVDVDDFEFGCFSKIKVAIGSFGVWICFEF